MLANTNYFIWGLSNLHMRYKGGKCLITNLDYHLTMISLSNPLTSFFYRSSWLHLYYRYYQLKLTLVLDENLLQIRRFDR